MSTKRYIAFKDEVTNPTNQPFSIYDRIYHLSYGGGSILESSLTKNVSDQSVSVQKIQGLSSGVTASGYAWIGPFSFDIFRILGYKTLTISVIDESYTYVTSNTPTGNAKSVSHRLSFATTALKSDSLPSTGVLYDKTFTGVKGTTKAEIPLSSLSGMCYIRFAPAATAGTTNGNIIGIMTVSGWTLS